MVAINFRKEFAEKVRSGKKRQTIREKCRAFSGCKLQLYYGQRTKLCRKLKDAVCKSVCSITITSLHIYTSRDGYITNEDSFARKDGFKDFPEMWKFFEPRAKDDGAFHGWLIEW